MPSGKGHANRLFALAIIAFSSRAGAEEPPSAPKDPGVPPVTGDAPPREAPPAASPAPEPSPAPKAVLPKPPQPAAPTVVSVVAAPPPTDAAVHMAADYDGAWLEGRSRVDRGDWQRLCAAPCDKTLRVEGLELRVTAPKMTASNPFVIDPGAGTARLRVSGGSATTRELGIIGLAAGLPVTFGGMTLFGFGSLEDQQSVRTAGIVTLAVGATAIVAALPLLMIGSTTVRNEKGSYIAQRLMGFWVF